ncbi:Pre-mRNA cleavage complex 2 protein Pcf11 [Eumeta japonica]|uniref:Pre-mRNA cleavage complex 2 protein Pcf11 n=1 Tax=Eumeta variegata TaxID=151549 RepID=A0A4C1YPE3_EUMVA|nr:Pre-mRNA cleavage complex 2 protein Pcf11 [Eumeta japonica]
MAKEVAEDYASSLADLTVNSKPLINMLTILAEENIDHAGVIVETVEKHLEKVHSDIKLPVLYLVDSIVKNVGGEYVQKFAQVIVNMFTKTFKQVDEKTRSQMYKLRETWFEVFPATKLYQLDVKVNLIDPAWPIQQYKIHVNPNFLKKPIASSSSTPTATSEEDKIKSILARKEEELLMLKQKKTEMEQEQARRQREQADKNVKRKQIDQSLTTVLLGWLKAIQVPGPINPVLQGVPSQVFPNTNGVLTAVTSASTTSTNQPETVTMPVKQRLGPPVHVNKSTAAAGGARIAPVSGAMLASVRRDPRLARHQSHATASVTTPTPPLPPPPSLMQSTPAIAPNVFDIKPLTRPERITKRKNVITIDVRPDAVPEDARTRRDPRIEKRFKAKQEDRPARPPRRNDDREKTRNRKSEDAAKPNTTKKYEDKSPRSFESERPSKTLEDNEQSNAKATKDQLEADKDDFDLDTKQKTSKINVDEIIPRFPIVDSKKINKLPPIPKITNRDGTAKPVDNKEESVPTLVKKRKEGSRNDKRKKREKDRSNSSSPDKKSKILESKDNTRENKQNKAKEELMEVDPEKPEEAEVVTFKELKNYHKERYMRRNKETSESPERTPKPQTLLLEDKLPTVPSVESEASSKISHSVRFRSMG